MRAPGHRTLFRRTMARRGESVPAVAEARQVAGDAAKMRAAILAERAKGTSAAKLAAKYGVSTAYIYMIKA